MSELKVLESGRLRERNWEKRVQELMNEALFSQREGETSYTSYELELAFFRSVNRGDLESVERTILFFSQRQYCVLSQDAYRQRLFEFVGSLILVCRQAIEGGMPQDIAFSLQSCYCQCADECKTAEEIVDLFGQMARDFTRRMAEISGQRRHTLVISKCMEYIRNHLYQTITTEELVEHCHLCASRLRELFRQEVGVTIVGYIQKKKIEEAKRLLQITDYSLITISSYLAFSSQSYFVSVFKKHTGLTPSEYKRRYLQREDHNVPNLKIL